MTKITCKFINKKSTFNYITKLEQLKSYLLTSFIELPQQFTIIYNHNGDNMIIENQKDLDKIIILNQNELNLDIHIQNPFLTSDIIRIAVCEEIENIIQNVSHQNAQNNLVGLNIIRKQSKNGRENSFCIRESKFNEEHESRLMMKKTSKKLIRISPKKDHESLSSKIEEIVTEKFNKIFDDLVEKSYDKIVQIDSEKCIKENKEYDSIVYNQILQKAISNYQNPEI